MLPWCFFPGAWSLLVFSWSLLVADQAAPGLSWSVLVAVLVCPWRLVLVIAGYITL